MTTANPSPSAIPNSMSASTNSITSGGPRVSTPGASAGSHLSTSQSQSQNQNFSSLVSTVLETTGTQPPSLVGPSTTVVGDTLYVFGGRSLAARLRPQLMSDMYALDLVSRVWRKLETRGTIPPPRYFHSMCVLGDTKLVCFGGMSPAAGGDTSSVSSAASLASDAANEVMVMADLHIYDIPTSTWTYIPTTNPPEGRYAHCVTVLSSSAVFAGANSSAASITSGAGLDGAGAAEMVVVGGQDSANHYIEEINVFNLRSLQWVSKTRLDRQCGAYRSVVAPLGRTLSAADIGAGPAPVEPSSDPKVSLAALSETHTDAGNAMLIYSNYNFLSVKLELQLRLPDGTLTERPMGSMHKPPGLRFPNGGVLDSHFVVSGTYLTSSKQEYALWALDLRTLDWSRIDAGSVFTAGSWGRGFLWPRRNAFVILGDKSRSLVEDYNNRRINFTNLCVVELEAFGLYENHRHTTHPAVQKSFSAPAQELGRMVLGMKEMADMELLAVGGERVPVNSRIVGKRWGPYFLHLLNATHPNPPPPAHRAVSMATITPASSAAATAPPQPPSTAGFNPLDRPRTLYMPHTHQTLLTLTHFLYTGTLPAAHHPQSSPQILCSLLQLARPYRIDGLLEAVVERLHQVLDGKNAAAVFNAAAMAAGGGEGVGVIAAEMAGGVGGKRGLRGLMEGRRLRERGKSLGAQSLGSVRGGTFGMG
ncbi:hypothetical protein EDC01DRAFT_720980 [Geopyxis carbonaria]|nr:hypothetical protein EDC01DRAFT_720980 [Geopyxis carbonaria]